MSQSVYLADYLSAGSQHITCTLYLLDPVKHLLCLPILTEKNVIRLESRLASEIARLRHITNWNTYFFRGILVNWWVFVNVSWNLDDIVSHVPHPCFWHRGWNMEGVPPRPKDASVGESQGVGWAGHTGPPSHLMMATPRGSNSHASLQANKKTWCQRHIC